MGDAIEAARRRYQAVQGALFLGPSAGLVDVTRLDALIAEMLAAGSDVAALGEDPRDGGRVVRMAQRIEQQALEIDALRGAVAEREAVILAKDAEIVAVRTQTSGK